MLAALSDAANTFLIEGKHGAKGACFTLFPLFLLVFISCSRRALWCSCHFYVMAQD